MSERAGDSAATVRAGETSNRPAEAAPPAPPMDGDFDAPDNIRDIDAALADVAEDLARLDDAASEPEAQAAPAAPPHRGAPAVQQALADVSEDLAAQGPQDRADTLAALDAELAGNAAPDEPSANAPDIEDAIGKIFEQQASAVRRAPKPKAPPSPPPAASSPPAPAPEVPTKPAAAPQANADAPVTRASPAAAPSDDAENEVEIEIEEIDANASAFEAPTDLITTRAHPGASPDGDGSHALDSTLLDGPTGSAPSAASAAAAAAAAAAPAPTRAPAPPADDAGVPHAEPSSVGHGVEDEAAQAEVEIEIEEVEARAAPTPAKPAPPPAKSAPAAAKAPPKADALAQAAEAAAAARTAASAPAAGSSKFGALVSPLVGALVIVNKPFGKMPKSVRDTIGLLGAGTLFNAVCAWVYWLLIR